MASLQSLYLIPPLSRSRQRTHSCFCIVYSVSSNTDHTMRIFDLFYLTLVSCLLSLTIPESQGRWSALYRNVLSLISYARLTCSTLSRPNYFAIVTNSPSSDDSFCLIGEAGVCRQAAFGIDDTCHPLDAPTTPTPTLVLNVSATRTVTAIAASPIAFNPILYKDTFATQFDAKNVLRKSKRPKSVLGHILSEKHSVHLPDFLSAAISTIIVVRMLTVRNPLTDSLVLQ